MAYFRCTGGGSGATLTLTFSSEFYGQTITATNGTKTVTKVAPSTGTMEITLPESGTWVISCTVSGSTYTTTVEVDIDYTATLEAIPDGSTVTPTDDIQTWLKCAGITDKTTYTTLADVLADTETFIALCADSNACDYMARSTTWALAEGSVPAMTSDTTPEGQVIYSAVSSGWGTYQVFTDTGGWVTPLNATPCYFGYKFENPTIINRISLIYTVNNGTVASNISFAIQGSNIGNSDDWTDLGTITVTGTTQSRTSAFCVVNNTTSYTYYRLYTTTALHLNPQYFVLNFLQFYQADITTNSTAMLIVGKYNYCANKLISNATWAEALAGSSYWQYAFDISVPTMTSNTTPSGVASASHEYSSNYAAWKAFDGNNSTGWAGNNVATAEWLQYKFPSPVVINAIAFSTAWGTNIQLGDFKIQGSNDNGTTWTDIYSGTVENSQSLASVILYRGFENTTAYSIYRMNMLNSHDGSLFTLYTLQFYGRTEKGYTGTVIHSAVEDTTYYVSGGSNVPFCTIASGDTETVLASTIESLKNQTVTLYSSVAKDSTNLSNDYSKAVRITPNVTEIYLMPDGAVYWYGHTSQTLGKTVWIGSSAGNNFTYNKNNMSASTTGSNQNNTATTTSKVFVSGNKIKYIRGDSHDDSGALKVKEASVVENIERYVGLGYRTGTGGVGIYVIHSTSTGQVNTGSDTNATENEGFVGLSGTLTVYALWYE